MVQGTNALLLRPEAENVDLPSLLLPKKEEMALEGPSILQTAGILTFSLGSEG